MRYAVSVSYNFATTYAQALRKVQYYLSPSYIISPEYFRKEIVTGLRSMSDSQEQEAIYDSLPFYPPNNDKEEFEISRREFDQITKALKDEKFRKLLAEYVDDVQDPDNQKTYQEEVREVERQNGKTIHFLNPVPGYVIKTSVNGEKKGFINICSNPLIKRATARKSTESSKNGCMWSIPYAQSPAREDVDKAGKFCQVYDVIFHPDSLILADENRQLRDKIEEVALDAVEGSFNVSLDRNNVKKPKIQYKGHPCATVIRYKIDEPPPSIVDLDAIKDELPPQSFKFDSKSAKNGSTKCAGKKTKQSLDGKATNKAKKVPEAADAPEKINQERTTPIYSIKYRSHADMQDCCIDNQLSRSKSIPDEVILSIDLPLLRDSSTLDADVVDNGWYFELKSNRKAFYHLRLKLPFQVYEDSSKATFDKDKRKLCVSMKTAQMKQQLARSFSDDVFETGEEVDEDEENSKPVKNVTEKVEKGRSDTDVGYESTTSNENIPTFVNGCIVVKSILKGSSANPRCRSMSESWLEHMGHIHDKEEFMSLESLAESNELLITSESSGTEKSVKFSDQVQRQLYRSNSSILGQKKKNQKRNKSKRKNRERHNSEGSVSSMDDDLAHQSRNRNDDPVGQQGATKPAITKNKKQCQPIDTQLVATPVI